MCGIAGIFWRDGRAASAGDVHAMCEAMVHRGPDDEGIYVGDGVALGMRRLSIIDLPTGHQPIANEDGSVVVVFNGEIYNYRELRQELIARGHRFTTTSDTEVIVHLYEEYGVVAIERLRGMFGIAIWDARRHELLLARDRLGIKPLFVAETGAGVAFASELKALLQLPDLPRALSWPALGHLFAFQATPATQSIVDGIWKLDAGHRATVGRRRPLLVERYWDIDPAATLEGTEDELLAQLNALLEESVDLHLRSDVPVGAFLSGGVDSSAVVQAIVRRGQQPKTFSVGFDDPAFDELPHARVVAEALGTEHHELRVAPEALDIIERLAWHLDEPFGDSSAVPTYIVSRLASEHVKVVLTGDGGDELFGGYDKYMVEQQERRFDRIPARLRRALGTAGSLLPTGTPGRRYLMHMALDGPDRYLNASALFNVPEQGRLLTREAEVEVRRTDPAADVREALCRNRPGTLAALQYCDLRGYLPLDILVKVDRMTMAHSIEARPPLLDHRLVEFAMALPDHMKLRGGTTKYLLKRAVREALPPGIADRRKQGFAVPLGHWFRGPWTEFARDLLLSKASRERGILNPRYVEHLFRLHRLGRNMDRELWMLVSFEQWCRLFLDRAPAPAPAPMRVRAGAVPFAAGWS